jgi:putative tricarboxylic transport membrane protein
MGIDFLPLAMGLFGVSEILNIALEKQPDQEYRKIRIRELYPTREETRRSVGPILRGSVLGFFVGLLPGPCNVLSTFIAYAIEKKVSKAPETFGKGAVEGVVAPESANNSAVMGAMIPLLTLGIPFAAPSAVMLAGLRMHNVEPGPMLFTNMPEMFWTFIAAMYIGNVMLLILNLPLVGLFGRIAVIRPAIIMPAISLICLIGVYSVRNSMFDVWIMIVSGVIGYFLRKWKFPIAPFIIGVVLAPTMENSVRQSLMLFKGNPLLIAGRPVAMTLLSVAIVFILYRIVSSLMGKKIEFKGEESV